MSEMLANALRRLVEAEREGVRDPIAEKIVRRLVERSKEK